jgi:hypothetical protein
MHTRRAHRTHTNGRGQSSRVQPDAQTAEHGLDHWRRQRGTDLRAHEHTAKAAHSYTWRACMRLCLRWLCHRWLCHRWRRSAQRCRYLVKERHDDLAAVRGGDVCHRRLQQTLYAHRHGVGSGHSVALARHRHDPACSTTPTSATHATLLRRIASSECLTLQPPSPTHRTRTRRGSPTHTTSPANADTATRW